jgi:hypothetical protein
MAPATNSIPDACRNAPEAAITAKRLPIASGFTVPLGRQTMPNRIARNPPMASEKAVRLSQT